MSYNEFKRGYIGAIEWLTIDCPDWQLDQMTEQDGETWRDGFTEQIWQDNEIEWIWANEALKKIESDARDFYNTHLGLLNEAVGMETDAYDPEYKIYDWDSAGYDYWLTRNGHGVGYWDRGLGEVGDRLTKACGYTAQYCLLGDDGLVYIEG